MVRIRALLGNSQWLDGGAMFGNVPRAVWERWEKPDAASRIHLACRALLIEHAGKKVLCETGIGNFFEPKLAERYGVMESGHVLLANLAAIGLTEEAIDAVILSHLHFDHAGGLLPSYEQMQDGDDRLLFPRARYLVGKEAFARALTPHPRDRASFIPGLAERLRDSGRLSLVDGECHPDWWPERLSFRYSHGHTPGQMHTVMRGRERSVVFCGDLVPGRAWVHLPVTMGYDRFAEQVIDEKRAFYDQALTGNWLLFFTHDFNCGAADLAVDASGKFQPVRPLPPDFCIDDL